MQVKKKEDKHIIVYLFYGIFRMIGKLAPGQGKFKQSKMPFIQVK